MQKHQEATIGGESGNTSRSLSRRHRHGGASTGASGSSDSAVAAAGNFEGGETKLYQVPNSLLEIARANARLRGSSGNVTPVAPRPDAAQAASASAYAAVVSRVPSLRAVPAIAEAAASPSVEPPSAPLDVPPVEVAVGGGTVTQSVTAPVHVGSAPSFSRYWAYAGVLALLGYFAQRVWLQ